MATCCSTTASSSLMLRSYGYSKPNPEDQSLLSFKPKSFPLYPLITIITPIDRISKAHQCFSFNQPKHVSKFASLLSSAVATPDIEVSDDVETIVDDGAIPLVKIKTGKAALPLKSDRRRSKRFLEIQKLKENKQEYDLKAAISLIKQMASTKFVETAEAHFRLNIDPKYNDQQLRATVSLPKGTGQTVKVAVLTQGEKFDEAKNAGADIVGGEDLIEQIKGGFMEFDKLIASPDMMPKVASLGKILGPRGLMPNPKAGTVTTNIPQKRLGTRCAYFKSCKFLNILAWRIVLPSVSPMDGTILTNGSPFLLQAIGEFKKGKVEFRADKTGIVHIPFGKVDFPEEDLIINFIATVKSIEANKPSGAKGVYWKSAHICSSMGPSIRLNIKEMIDFKPPTDV
ncbi:hypothetical protein ACFE04_003167 [Oxalis oulophora]